MNERISHTSLLMDMLSIPAVSREEKIRADFLENYMKQLGWPVTRIHHNLLVAFEGGVHGYQRCSGKEQAAF